MEAQALFEAGRLAEAIEAMNAQVKEKPQDPDRRAFLSDLLCLAGSFERADRQLESILTFLPGAIATVSMIRQLIRAEQWRSQFYLEGRVPEFLSKPDEGIRLQLRAALHLREGENEAAADLLEQAEEERKPIRGRMGGTAFEDLRDCDDLVGGVFEVLTSTGKYYWIPMERVRRLELRPLERARDLMWRRAGMEVTDGPDGEVFLAAIYAPLADDASAQLRLGRETQWTEASPVRGSGLRTLLVGEEAIPMHDLAPLELEPESR